MPATIKSLLLGLGLAAVASVAAHASPACVKDPEPLELKDDFVKWTISAAPGSECLQGLRWSYMRIHEVVILKPPTHGKLEFVGYGIRYTADADNREPDSFVLVVSGHNRHDPGKTIVDVAVKHPVPTMVSELHRRPQP